MFTNICYGFFIGFHAKDEDFSLQRRHQKKFGFFVTDILGSKTCQYLF